LVSRLGFSGFDLSRLTAANGCWVPGAVIIKGVIIAGKIHTVSANFHQNVESLSHKQKSVKSKARIEGRQNEIAAQKVRLLAKRKE
jgi:hypothetical protein